MPIKLPIKATAASNKNKTLGKNATQPEYPETKHQIPTPFIDKISLVLTPPNDEDSYEIFNAVFSVADDNTLFSDAPGGKKGAFKFAKRIILKSVFDFKRLPLFQMSYDKHKKQALKLRLEFVPVDLGPKGMAELHVAVNMFFDGGWEYVVHHAHITRIDVTVDIPDTRMDSFLFLPQQAATTTQWQYKGKLQSYYSGKSKGNQTKIYDRKAKRLSKGQQWPGKAAVRIERKLINQHNMKLSDLHTLANPFAGMTMTENVPQPPDSPPTKKWVWAVFCDSVKVRGLTDALALLPQAQRTKFRKYIKANPISWWKPDEIWKTWGPMLDELQIAKSNWE